VWRTYDLGTGWIEAGDNLPFAPVVDLKIDFGRRRIVAATQGRGLWSLRLPAVDERKAIGSGN
jgi:hypothetical protein